MKKYLLTLTLLITPYVMAKNSRVVNNKCYYKNTKTYEMLKEMNSIFSE